MSSRFAKITKTIWASARFNALPSPLARLAYFYVHTNPHGNSAGVYRLPGAYLAADMRVSEADAAAAMDALIASGLIEYDRGEEIVLINGWWKHNPVMNRKHLQAVTLAILDLPRRSEFRLRAAFEASASMIATMRLWSDEQKGRDAKLDALSMCSRMVRSTLAEASESARLNLRNSVPIEVSIEVSIALSIPQERLSFLDIEQDRDLEGDLDLDLDPDVETAPRHSRAPRATSRAIQDDIAALAEKARAESGRRPR